MLHIKKYLIDPNLSKKIRRICFPGFYQQAHKVKNGKRYLYGLFFILYLTGMSSADAVSGIKWARLGWSWQLGLNVDISNPRDSLTECAGAGDTGSCTAIHTANIQVLPLGGPQLIGALFV